MTLMSCVSTDVIPRPCVACRLFKERAATDESLDTSLRYSAFVHHFPAFVHDYSDSGVTADLSSKNRRVGWIHPPRSQTTVYKTLVARKTVTHESQTPEPYFLSWPLRESCCEIMEKQSSELAAKAYATMEIAQYNLGRIIP